MAHAISGQMRAHGVGGSCWHRRQHSYHGRPIHKLAASAAEDVAMEVQMFNQLKQLAQVQGCLDMRPTPPAGYGLFTTRAAQTGEVLMQVPRSLTIILDDEQSLQLPEGRWPRLQQAIAKDPPLTWDLLFAVALMDGLAGDGGQFWAAWCQAVLPAPNALCLPMCWSADRLQTLQHDAIVQAAKQQQDRLRALFPALSEPSGESGGEPSCSWLAWAFACVRSRSFKFGDDSFALVPFLDIANHSNTPNADFRVHGAHCGLFAMRDIPPDQQVCITYSGAEGYTNQRWMAQYGFVPEANTADRIVFDLPVESSAASNPQQGIVAHDQELGMAASEQQQSDSQSAAAAHGTAQAGAAAGKEDTAWRPLSLAHMQDRMGDELFLDAISGKLPYSSAVLRSLPWQPETGEAANVPMQLTRGAGDAQSAAVDPGAFQEVNGTAAATQVAAHMHTARELLRQCKLQLQACATSLQQDEEELTTGLQDPRYIAAVKYRVERKRLLNTCIQLLRLYSGS